MTVLTGNISKILLLVCGLCGVALTGAEKTSYSQTLVHTPIISVDPLDTMRIHNSDILNKIEQKVYELPSNSR